jgi:hypothetical protein
MTRKNLLTLTAALALLPLGVHRACAQGPVTSGTNTVAADSGLEPAVELAREQRPNVQIYYTVIGSAHPSGAGMWSSRSPTIFGTLGTPSPFYRASDLRRILRPHTTDAAGYDSL